MTLSVMLFQVLTAYGDLQNLTPSELCKESGVPSAAAIAIAEQRKRMLGLVRVRGVYIVSTCKPLIILFLNHSDSTNSHVSQIPLK